MLHHANWIDVHGPSRQVELPLGHYAEDMFMQTIKTTRTAAAILLMTIYLLLAACSSGGSSGGGGSTPAPGPDDEPIAEESRFNNATGFQVVREPGARLPDAVETEEFTDAQFALGPPQPTFLPASGPADPQNQAPFFDNLENLEVVAGDTLEIVYRPQDPGGELPGMFPEKLPQGATFDDNFDGSKTFRWQPLQADVGILKFTVTAVDPADSNFRASYPILIKTVLPDDPSTIPNVAPMLDEIIPHTARLGDAVVFELKGIDLNGTTPTLELPNPPAGASFEQHPRFEEVYVLKFVPTTSGVVTVDVVARDSVDSSLSSVTPVSITVREAADFQRSGQPLRSLAANRNIQVGFAALQSFYHRPDGAIYAATAALEYDIVTPENSMKMDYLNPEPGRYQFAATDNLVAFANAANMSIHGHPLIWYRQLPAWILNSDVGTRETHMRDYINRVMNRYANVMPVWDVINEPMADDGSLRDSVWLEAMGSSYIDIAMTEARAAAPTGTLLINEFDIAMAGPKFDGLMSVVDDLQQRDIPLDGIGFQLHLFTSFDQFDELRSNFSAVAQRGLDIYITELDVSLADGASTQQQADVYRQIVSICLEQPNCKAIQTWGLTDQYSFRSIFDPLPFDRAYQAKPAYQAIQDALLAN